MSTIKQTILTQISEERVKHGQDFFQARDISFKTIRKAFKYQIDEYHHLLLTSSPVHGIANIKSDIDVICITVNPVPTPRMATQSFEAGSHFEIISFSREELEGALGFLRDLAVMSMAASLTRMKAWNKNCPISRKYLERIINGVDISMTTPYIEAMPTLGIVWKRSSFDMYRKCIILAILAEKAGESRGRTAYAMNGLLYLMDCIMSYHSYVFSNKKWYLYRFKKFLQDKRDTPGFKPLTDSIAALFQLLTQELKVYGQSLQEHLLNLYQSSLEKLEIEFREEPLLSANQAVEKKVFLENSSLYRDGKKHAVLFKNHSDEVLPGSLRDLIKLDQAEAAAILRKIRAGVLTITIPQSN